MERTRSEDPDGHVLKADSGGGEAYGVRGRVGSALEGAERGVDVLSAEDDVAWYREGVEQGGGEEEIGGDVGVGAGAGHARWCGSLVDVGQGGLLGFQ